ncbi:serine/threonine-protein kinase [Lacipirellula limnantheis]|uniref:Serine/threonine-protein kinase PknB n=1 Tax=Lacipirellula limnantheis TaxID=2528024 RepID=A0A517TSE2_9BACT|nr:serine/threonine-protein kinase [Lacipirellula limnantheis]QDT71296.1 Serine/threonine-protein kinase PknB [Lacipirellula limnantheis]
MDPSPTRQLALVVARYDRARGGSVLRRQLLDEWPHPELRERLHLALWQCDLARSTSGVNRAAMFAEAATELADRGLLSKLCRAVHGDTAELGGACYWEDYSELGISADELQLRLDGELLHLGSVLHERYVIDARLGQGAFGVVYRGEDPAAQRSVAIKVPRGGDRQGRERAARLLRREVDVLRAASGLGTPALLDVVLVGEDLPAIVMEFVEGTRLTQWLRQTPIAPRESAELVKQLAETVDRLDRAGFVHRDLKPDNIVVRPTGKPCLLDMGVAFAEADRFTTEGFVVGTLNYMAPEGLLGMTSQLDGRSDVWSLGAIFYEVLTRKTLQCIGNREEALVASVAIHIDRPSFPKETPQSLQKICLRCLAREANERFSSAGELAAALGRWGSAPETINEQGSAQQLIGWRLGMKYGAALENLAYFGRHLHQMGNLASATGMTTAPALQALGMARGFAFGLVIAYDDLRKLALPPGVALPALEHSRKLQESFYKKDQSIETAEWLRAKLPELHAHLESAYCSLVEGLRTASDAASACCEMAARCTLLLLSQEDYDELDAVWLRTGIGGDEWQQFKETFERGPTAKESLIRLDKAVERRLHFGEPATFGENDLLRLFLK